MEALFGSSILPAVVDVNGEQVALGEIVRGAFNKSHLSVREWNMLDEETREAKLARHLKSLQKNS
jgi:hypothetical protein